MAKEKKFITCDGNTAAAHVDGSNLSKHVAYMSGSCVTITSDKFFFFSHFTFR